MSKKLHDRISRLERAMPSLPDRTHPFWQRYDRRVRISTLFMSWLQGEIEKPELTDPRDVEEWADAEMVVRIAKMVTMRTEAEGRDVQADEWHFDEEGE